MEAEQGRGPGLPISGGAVVIALIVGGLFVQQLAFKGSRPGVPGDGVRPCVGPEDVQARLWEDPFKAVRRHREDTKRDRHDIGSLAKQIVEKTSEDKANEDKANEDKASKDKAKVIVLGVMVFGGPYAENIERRIRSRYATLAALGVLGYVPEDAEHLGYIEIEKDEQKDIKEGLPEFVPYEWFVPESGSKSMVLLLWLDDDAFHPTPLAKIGKLKSDLEEKLKEIGNLQDKRQELCKLEDEVNAKKPNDCETPKITFKILGPAGSTNLRAMTKEILSKKSGDKWETLEGVQIFSTSATADDASLLDEKRTFREVTDRFASFNKGKIDEAESHKAKADDVRFLRTIGTDKALTDTLVDELARRGADPADSRNHIALISEWDTFYGRALPRTFIRSVKDKSEKEDKSDKKKEIDWIHQFSYLRGIDGQVPGASKSNAPGSVSSDKKKKDEETEAIERPVGRGQFDYLRRLATRLERCDEEIKLENDHGIKAIGVLGSDVYDKLLVLQAMRDRFPGAIFFTTDLDARLLHREEFKWTHNLVIASNFGLQLRRELQEKVPPFRDNYQTSLFFSTMIAVHSGPESLDQKTIGKWLKPRIFEVSRRGAFDLSIDQVNRKADQENGKRGILKLLDGSLPSIHPPRPSPWPSWNTVWPIGLAVLLAAVFFFLYTRHYRYSQAKTTILSPPFYFVGCAVIGVLVLAVLICTQGPEGEPFALFQGISLWPTVFLRFFCGVLSVYLLYTGCRKIQDSNDALSRFFVSKPIPSPGKSLAEGRARNGTVDAASLWKTYSQQSNLKSRCSRVIWLSIVYFAFCFSIILIFGQPFVPYRGNISLCVDKIVLLFFAVPSLILLILGVVDATKLSVWLIRRLSEKKTAWAHGPTRCFGKALNIDPRYVNDYIDIRVIAEHSKVVGQLIYYPFIVMILMMVSRTRYFDNWDLPLGLFIVILLGLFYAVRCAMSLRSSAERARRTAVERLWEQQVHAKGQGDEAKHVTEQITLLIDSIRSIRQGAFAPFFQQPFVQALGLFLGSGGSLWLLQYLS